MKDYDGIDSALAVVQNTAFVVFVISVMASLASFCLGGVFTEILALWLVLAAIVSAFAMHYSGRLRVKYWTERIKKS